MKKLLLSLLVGSMAFNGYAADYDTLYVGPNQDVRYEIKLNTTKYPELKDMTVSDVVWYLGDPHNRLTDKGNVAIQLAETDFKIEEENDKYYLEYRQVNGTGDEDRLAYYLFYAFEPGTKAGVDAGHFDGYTTDTVAYIYRYNELTAEDIKGITYTRDGETFTIHVEFDNGNSPMDAQSYEVFEVDENGEQIGEVLATSSTPSIPLTIDRDMRIGVAVRNPGSVVTSEQTLYLNYIPDLEIASIGYRIYDSGDVVVGGDHLDGKTEVEFTSENKHSIQLFVNTSWGPLEDLKEHVVFTWTKDGAALPANAKAERGVVTLEPFTTGTHNGVYKCVVSDNGEEVGVAYFAINAELPTDNEIITANSSMYVTNGYLYIDQVSAGVKVYNINGSLVKTIPANTGNVIPLNLPKGIYVITNGKEVIKAVN